jgi:hypothetical protein
MHVRLFFRKKLDRNAMCVLLLNVNEDCSVRLCVASARSLIKSQQGGNGTIRRTDHALVRRRHVVLSFKQMCEVVIFSMRLPRRHKNAHIPKLFHVARSKNSFN